MRFICVHLWQNKISMGLTLLAPALGSFVEIREQHYATGGFFGGSGKGMARAFA